MPFSKVFHVENEAGLGFVAVELAALVAGGGVIALNGPLGAGKTALARVLIRYLAGNPNLEVPSPTFTLVQTYETGAGTLWHFDLYRLKSPEEVYELGWEDAVTPGNIVLIEWPERLAQSLPRPCVSVTISGTGTARTIEVSYA